MRRTGLRAALALMTALCLLLGSASGAFAEKKAPYYGQHGTAKHIDGRTVVVSIFADDAATSWNFPLSGAESELYRKIHRRLGIGLEWLEQQTMRYGVGSGFVWDYDEVGAAGGLSYYASFKHNLMTDGWDAYLEVWQYIHDYIDINWLLAEYKAENVVFAVHLNAPSSDSYRSYTRCANWTDVEDHQVYYEVCFFVPYGHGRENTPAVYAHEIMHCFGAADLYCAGSEIPQTYVDHLEQIRAFDVMNRCYYSEYDRVTCEFSDVDAYYLGLTGTCADKRTYGLGPNIFERWGR